MYGVMGNLFHLLLGRIGVGKKGYWNISDLEKSIPVEAIQDIMNVPLDGIGEVEDKLIWSGSQDGKFSEVCL